MGAISDALGGPRFGFYLATAFAVVLFAGSVFNLVRDPAGRRLAQLDDTEYRAEPPVA